MGIVQLIDPFYIDLPEETYRQVPTVGQICCTVIGNPLAIPIIADVERASPSEHYATKFDLRPMTEADYVRKQRLPIQLLGLRETEELLCQRSSLRPAIVIAAGMTIFDDMAKLLKQKGRKHLQERNVLVVPVYGAEGENHPGGFPPLMVARIRALRYRQFFFLPSGNSPFAFDGVARLDRIHVAFPEASPGVRSVSYRATRKALSQEALSCLLGMLRVLFGSDKEEELDTIKAIVREALPETAKVPE